MKSFQIPVKSIQGDSLSHEFARPQRAPAFSHDRPRWVGTVGTASSRPRSHRCGAPMTAPRPPPSPSSPPGRRRPRTSGSGRRPVDPDVAPVGSPGQLKNTGIRGPPWIQWESRRTIELRILDYKTRKTRSFPFFGLGRIGTWVFFFEIKIITDDSKSM